MDEEEFVGKYTSNFKEYLEKLISKKFSKISQQIKYEKNKIKSFVSTLKVFILYFLEGNSKRCR